jgi:hypothetical protein
LAGADGALASSDAFCGGALIATDAACGGALTGCAAVRGAARLWAEGVATAATGVATAATAAASSAAAILGTEVRRGARGSAASAGVSGGLGWVERRGNGKTIGRRSVHCSGAPMRAS